MTQVEVVTLIEAPIEVVFDAARDMSLHSQALEWTGERIVSGPTILNLGDEITFEGKHFGVRQRLTARITEFERPRRFVDEMVKGAFKSVYHEHLFEENGQGTRMTDRLRFVAPLGPLGWLAERLFLAAYMRRLLERKNEAFKQTVERKVREI